MGWLKFYIPKRNGKLRTIYKPDDALKQQLRADIPLLERTFAISPFAHGFVRNRNTVTATLPHVGKKFVGTADVKDFFPSIMPRYFDKYAVVRKDVSYDQYLNVLINILPRHFVVERGQAFLPQGGPASPLLANAYLCRFDWLMARIAACVDVDYSRYADNLIFSGDSRSAVSWCIAKAKELLRSYKLELNPEKTRIMGQGTRQIVCGIVLNKKPNLPREWRKRLRAAIHQRGMDDPHVRGALAYANMVINNTKPSEPSRHIVKSYDVLKELLK